jgi:feruloyl esterase
MRRLIHALPIGALTALLSGCAGAPAASVSGLPCGQIGAALQALHPEARVLGAERVRPDAAAAHPAHCRLHGRLHDRIGFEMRLPAGWNLRFVHQTHGGTDGVLRPAFGGLGVWPVDALGRGYAVLSSDGGHVADDPARAEFGLARGVAFALDPQARNDFAHAAIDALWPVAQAVLKLHYGQAPRRNYMVGCGNGGRLGLWAASRWPERYDGIVAGAPALHWPRAALQHAWDRQQWRQASADPREALSPSDLRLVADRLVARCDALDMLVDGMVEDSRRCQKAFRLADLQCRPGQRSDCLAPAQVRALAAVLAGPHDSRGEPLYADWPLDPGLAAQGWRRWRLRSDLAAWAHQPVGATVGAAALAYLFSTPPETVPGDVAALGDWLERFDFDTAIDRGRTVAAPYAESVDAAMSPPDAHSPRLAGFMQRGGKLLVYHGAADPAFSLHATLRFTERLQSHWGLAKAQTMLRSFAVPGMGHCQGGPATDRFDALGALAEWVENDRPPEHLVAALNPRNADLPAHWPVGRTRKLCPWPQVPRYAGGDAESAASFRCVMP